VIPGHDPDGAVAQGIEAGAAAHGGAWRGSGGMLGEGGGHRDQGHAPVGRLEEPGFARLGQLFAHAGAHQAGRLNVPPGESHPVDPVVAGMIVGHGHQVEAGPHQLFHQRRLGPHVGAAALMHGIGLVVVEQHFEIGECGVRTADHLDHLQEARFAVGRQAAGDDGVPSEGHGHDRGRGRLLAGRARRGQDGDAQGQAACP
jgi:hypothetical protein